MKRRAQRCAQKKTCLFFLFWSIFIPILLSVIVYKLFPKNDEYENKEITCFPDVIILIHGLRPPSSSSNDNSYIWILAFDWFFHNSFIHTINEKILQLIYETYLPLDIRNQGKIKIETFLYNSANSMDYIIENLDQKLQLYKKNTFSIIGISMGGIIATQWLNKNGTDNLCKIVTVASPHNGSFLLNIANNIINDRNLFVSTYGNISSFILEEEMIKNEYNKIFEDENKIDYLFIIRFTNYFINFDGVLFDNDQYIENKKFMNQISFHNTIHSLSPFFDPRITTKILLESIRYKK
jgi:predicted alpha/beta-fold hydrolase